MMATDKKKQVRGMAVFILGALFHAASKISDHQQTVKGSLDEGEEFVKEAESRGVSLPEE